MNAKITLAAFSTAALLTLVSCAGPAGRDRYESANYETVLADGAFEIRDYPAMMVASAPMAAGKSNQNSAFRTLFRYISGANEKEQKIAMTTPVFGTMQGEERSMSFVVPEVVAKAGAPKADDPKVAITERPAGRFAVYRYSGRWTEALDNEAREKLSAWAKENHLTPVGGYEKASYDPPFTLPSKRRNEVLIRIEK